MNTIDPSTLRQTGVILAVLIVVGVVALGVVLAGRPERVESAGNQTWGFQALPLVPLSPDGRFWWDGTAWVDSEVRAPQLAPRSQDGAWWWDGRQWRPVPRPPVSPLPT